MRLGGFGGSGWRGTGLTGGRRRDGGDFDYTGGGGCDAGIGEAYEEGIGDGSSRGAALGGSAQAEAEETGEDPKAGGQAEQEDQDTPCQITHRVGQAHPSLGGA